MKLVAYVVWRRGGFKCYELVECGHLHARPDYWIFSQILPCYCEENK